MKDKIKKVLESSSGFSFEMKVAREVASIGYNVEHSGTYTDPLTKKDREFDIRAYLKKGALNYRFAIECKSISKELPLIAHLCPIREKEQYHSLRFDFEVLIEKMIEDKEKKSQFYAPSLHSHLEEYLVSKIIPGKIEGCSRKSFYNDFKLVSKSLNKIKLKNKNEVLDNDSEVYPAYSQAINSLADLLGTDFKNTKLGVSQLFALPILVIPDETLWAVDYDQEGNITSEPYETNRVLYSLQKEFLIPSGVCSSSHHQSFLEIVTFSGLKKLLKQLFDSIEPLGSEESPFLKDEDLIAYLKADISRVRI